MSAHRQSMHVTFKLVGASDDERESSPEALAPSICGWVLADHLDNTLMVFEAEGRYLEGVVPTNNVDSPLRWNSLPGAATALGAPLDIPNSHLAGLVNTLLRLGLHTAHPLKSLLEVIEVTRKKGDSLSESRDANLATLMGWPLAVVRATVKIEVDKTSECEHSRVRKSTRRAPSRTSNWTRGSAIAGIPTMAPWATSWTTTMHDSARPTFPTDPQTRRRKTATRHPARTAATCWRTPRSSYG